MNDAVGVEGHGAVLVARLATRVAVRVSPSASVSLASTPAPAAIVERRCPRRWCSASSAATGRVVDGGDGDGDGGGVGAAVAVGDGVGEACRCRRSWRRGCR